MKPFLLLLTTTLLTIPPSNAGSFFTKPRNDSGKSADRPPIPRIQRVPVVPDDDIRSRFALTHEELAMTPKRFGANIFRKIDPQSIRLFTSIVEYIKALQLQKPQSRLVIKAAAELAPEHYKGFLLLCRENINKTDAQEAKELQLIQNVLSLLS